MPQEEIIHDYEAWLSDTRYQMQQANRYRLRALAALTHEQARLYHKVADAYVDLIIRPAQQEGTQR